MGEKLHKYDGNVIAFANKTDSEWIIFSARRDSLSPQFERYLCCDAGVIKKDIEYGIKDDIPVEEMLYEIVNSWDTAYVVRDDTIRLFYTCNCLMHKGDSIHDIYNVDSWEKDFYVYENDTFDILRFTFTEEDFSRPDTVAIPFHYFMEQRRTGHQGTEP